MWVCVCVCVCVWVGDCVSVCAGGTVNGVFIYRALKSKWLCLFVRKYGTVFLTQLSSPNIETKPYPKAQIDTACKTSASCSDKDIQPPTNKVQIGAN